MMIFMVRVSESFDDEFNLLQPFLTHLINKHIFLYITAGMMIILVRVSESLSTMNSTLLQPYLTRLIIL